MSDKDFYDILEIPKGSGDISVKRAYRRLTFKYHPDRREAGMSPEKIAEYDAALLEIQEAYEVLSNPEMKAAYDAVTEVLEEQKDVEWNEPNDGSFNQGVWNVPPGRTTPYTTPFTSGSIGYYQPYIIAPLIQYSSGSSSWAAYVPATKQRFSIHVDDAVVNGLTGLTSGQIVNVYVSGFSVMISPGILPPTMSSIPCRIIAVHYGTSPGMPVYADIELEKL